MSSLLPGFTYDIFISYRHKDNKYDGWVSEFVANLRKEVDATIKDDVSIYFDENPHDGLRETDDVDESLKGKLRCLIFIPILSQTYCDPKSFAWQHEFLAFNELMRHDDVGSKVSLPNGNVSSRILPVRIHDLDPSDKSSIENVLGPLRSIDFIYREQGVNRPLRPADSKADNLNKTDYRNQVNKIANAIKDLVAGLTHSKEQSQPAATSIKEQPKKTNKLVLIATGVAIFAIVIATGIYMFGRTGSGEGDFKYDVAVMYLENLTDDEKYSDGLVNLIQINLTEDTSLSIAPRHMLYEKLKAISPDSKVPDHSVATQLAASIGTKFMITGSVIQQSAEVMAQVELVEVSSGKVVTSKKVRGDKDNIFGIADQITGELMKGRSIEKEYNVKLISTDNYEAYKAFYTGVEHLMDVDIERASEYLGRAIQLDSSFASAYLYKATADNPYLQWTVYEDPKMSKWLVERATRDMDHLPRKDQLLARFTLGHMNGDGKETQMEILEQLRAIDPDDKFILLLMSINSFDEKAIRANEDYHKRNPKEFDIYNSLAYLYLAEHSYPKAIAIADEYLRTSPGVFNSLQSNWEVHLMAGDISGARKSAEKIITEFPKVKNRATWLAITDLVENKPQAVFEVYSKYRDSTRNVETRALGYNSMLLQGKVRRALSIADREIKDAKAAGDDSQAFYFHSDKALLYLFSGMSAEAQKELDKIITDSEELPYNPFIFLGHFYKGIDYVSNGNLANADKEIGILTSLIKEKKNDSRFNVFLKILVAERELLNGNFSPAEETLGPNPMVTGAGSAYLSTLNLKYLIASGKYEEALKFLDSVGSLLFAGRPNYGGNQVVFTHLVSSRDYYRGMVYAKMGDKKLAKHSYEIFLEQMKDADTETVQVKEAKTALKIL